MSKKRGEERNILILPYLDFQLNFNVFAFFKLISAKSNGMEVNQIFSHAGNMGLVLPEYLTKWTTEKVKAEGVNIIPESKVDAASVEDDKVKLTLNSGKEVRSEICRHTNFKRVHL